MLELRTNCENCGKLLPTNSTEAMICTFECTFCSECVTNHLYNVCPNCGGGFEKRPVRPAKLLEKYPASTAFVFQPVQMEKFMEKLASNKHIKPDER